MLASAAFIYNRAIRRPDRLTTSWEAYLILGFIIDPDGRPT